MCLQIYNIRFAKLHKQSAHELEYSVILNILSSSLSSGFLYSALGFCDYKTSKFKENAVDFAKGC